MTKKSLFPSRFGVINVGIIKLLTSILTVSDDTGQTPFDTAHINLLSSSERSLTDEVGLFLSDISPSPARIVHSPVWFVESGEA